MVQEIISLTQIVRKSGTDAARPIPARSNILSYRRRVPVHPHSRIMAAHAMYKADRK